MNYYYISHNKTKKKQKQKNKPLMVPIASKDAEHQELIAGESEKRQTLWKTAW